MQHGAEESTVTDLESMHAAGLVDSEIIHLTSLKEDIVTGKRGEATLEHKRLLFARYLYERGDLQG